MTQSLWIHRETPAAGEEGIWARSPVGRRPTVYPLPLPLPKELCDSDATIVERWELERAFLARISHKKEKQRPSFMA